MRVTQREIAEKTGVSQVTVSHVLHRPHRARISAERRREVLRVARELGYTPRNLTTHTIGLVVDAQTLWIDVTINLLIHADQILRRHGYRMMVVTLEPHDLAAGKELLDQKMVDGAIFPEWHGGAIRRLISPQVPWVLTADEELEDDSVDQVAVDAAQTAAYLTRYLHERGHRRIGLITGEIGIGYHERLERGFFQAMDEAGLPRACASLIRSVGQRGYETIEEELLALMSSPQPPTALLVGSPGGAMVALNRLQSAGYRVPEDISLLSCVDGMRLEVLRPAITAGNAVGREATRQAIERLIARIKAPATPPQRTRVPVEIVERTSVATIIAPR
jgi:LacI family transcriptional regulator